MLQKNLTAIVLNYGRELEVIKLINFYSQSKIKFIIVDGSVKKKILKLPQNFKYFFLTGCDAMKRLKFGITKVQTKYVCIMNDDEFIMENGVIKIINFLEKNLDIDYSFGVCLGFNFLINKVVWKVFYQRFLKIFYIMHESPLDRLSYYLKNNNQGTIILSICRIKKFRESLRNCQNFLTTPHANELLITSKMVINGKFKNKKYLYYLRNNALPPVTTKYHIASNKITDFFYNNSITARKERIFFFKVIQNELKKKNVRVDLDKIKKIYYQRFLRENRSLKLVIVAKKIKLFIPMYIYKKLSQLYYKMYVWKNYKRFNLLYLGKTAYKKKELDKTMDFLNANQ
jgi:glycosyltransferase domain-containing protein